MAGSVRHLARGLAILRILARHDALQPDPRLPLPATARLGIATINLLFGRRQPGLRRGEKLATALAALGPAFIKLGQVLSVRPDLVGEDLAADLGQLRDRLPSFAWSEAKALLEAELGPHAIDGETPHIFTGFEPVPVAAASVAQVHFAETPEGQPLAVKLLRPGVEDAFARDLALFAWTADLAERHIPGMARLRPGDVARLVADQVTIELDLRLEAAAASELAENFVDDPDLLVPRVDWNRTARRVLSLQRIEGIRIEDREALLAAGHDLPALAQRVIHVFLRQALRDGYFHADMHHGNLFVLADGRLGLVDFGIMGRLSMANRRFMAEMLGAFLSGDWRKAAQVHFDAGYVPADRDVELFAQACRSIGEPIRDKPVAEISIGRLLAQLFQITETFGMPTQPHLLLLQKTMVTVEGVARSLDPQVNFWDAARPEVEGWARENLGPEAHIREAANEAMGMLRRIPAVLRGLEERLANPAPPPAIILQPQPSRLIPWLLGLIAALLAAGFFLD